MNQSLNILKTQDNAISQLSQAKHQFDKEGFQIQSDSFQMLFHSIQALLSKSDDRELPKKMKFAARTYLILLAFATKFQGLLINGIIIFTIEKFQGNFSLLGNFKTDFLLNQKEHPESKDDEKLRIFLRQISEVKPGFTTPYDFISVMALNLPENTLHIFMDYIIDLCLIIPETIFNTSEEIFVGSCLFANYKKSCPDLILWLQINFPQSLTRAKELFLHILLVSNNLINNSVS